MVLTIEGENDSLKCVKWTTQLKRQNRGGCDTTFQLTRFTNYISRYCISWTYDNVDIIFGGDQFDIEFRFQEVEGSLDESTSRNDSEQIKDY